MNWISTEHLAIRVFPVPGGPCNSTPASEGPHRSDVRIFNIMMYMDVFRVHVPFGGLTPKVSKNSGWRSGSSIISRIKLKAWREQITVTVVDM